MCAFKTWCCLLCQGSPDACSSMLLCSNPPTELKDYNDKLYYLHLNTCILRCAGVVNYNHHMLAKQLFICIHNY